MSFLEYTCFWNYLEVKGHCVCNFFPSGSKKKIMRIDSSVDGENDDTSGKNYKP